MTQFTKARFQARLYAFCWTILETRQPNFDGDKLKEQNWIVTILQSLDYANEAEKEVINKLPDIIKIREDANDDRSFLVGTLEGKSIIYKHLDPNLLLEDKDVFKSEDSRSQAEESPASSSFNSSSSSNPITKRIILGCVAAFILGIIIYNLPVCKEYRDYKKVVNTHFVFACDDYLNKYHSSGRHSGDVMYLKVQRLDYEILNMADYLNTYPNHEHFLDVKSKYDGLWNEEIAKYESRDKSKEDKDAVAYMTEMLYYMRDHFCNNIYVNVDLHTNFKEYDEYDESIRLLLEIFNTDAMKIEDGMVSLKNNFTTQNRTELKRILVDGLQESFNRIFTTDFIHVVSNQYNATVSAPVSRFVCTINTQEDVEDDMAFPHIWVYQETLTKKVLGYLMGISIQIDATFTIPDSNVTYTYSEQGAPENEIKNIQDVKEGYLHMSAMCFAQFANKMSRNLGLKEIYFQGE